MAAQQNLFDPLLSRMITEWIGSVSLTTAAAPAKAATARPVPAAGPVPSTVLNAVLKETFGAKDWNTFLLAAAAGNRTTRTTALDYEGSRFTLTVTADPGSRITATIRFTGRAGTTHLTIAAA